jgi:hypothetical protein
VLHGGLRIERRLNLARPCHELAVLSSKIRHGYVTM